MKKVYIMIAAVTFVVGFVLGAVLLLANVTRKIESCCDGGDEEELRRIDGVHRGKRLADCFRKFEYWDDIDDEEVEG